MAVVVDLKLIVGMSLDVHVSRVPIALFGETLRAPVRPYAELRIPKPFGRAILFQRLPLRPERAGSDLAGGEGPGLFPNWRPHSHSVPPWPERSFLGMTDVKSCLGTRGAALAALDWRRAEGDGRRALGTNSRPQSACQF